MSNTNTNSHITAIFIVVDETGTPALLAGNRWAATAEQAKRRRPMCFGTLDGAQCAANALTRSSLRRTYNVVTWHVADTTAR